MFNFEPIKDEKEWKEWDGYIDLEGRFFQTKPSMVDYFMGSYNCHAEWAEVYLENKNINYLEGDNLRDTAQDYLVEVMGWVSVGFMSSMEEPHLCFEKSWTKHQENTLFKIFQLNEWDMKWYYKYLQKSERGIYQ